MKKRKVKIGILFGLFLVGGFYLDQAEESLNDNFSLQRNPIGGEVQNYDLILNAENVLEDYPYSLQVEPVLPDEEEIQGYFQSAKEEIENTICMGEDSVDHITEGICLRESYVDGKIAADWVFDNYDVMESDGSLIASNVPQNGILVQADVYLSGFDRQEIYHFGFTVFPPELTAAEKYLSNISKNLNKQMNQAGTQTISLPKEVEGSPLNWSLKKENYFIKILFLEIIIGCGLVFLAREQKVKERKREENQMLMDYPEIVSKIRVLTCSGMSLKYAMNRIAASYIKKRENKTLQKRVIYEAIIKMNREIQDGANEKDSLVRFGEGTGLRCYRRLVALLIEQEQKGTAGLNEKLKQEAEDAFAVRKATAKKLGEEATTKMLFPMILMLGIVMAIVIVPAIIGLDT